MKTEQEIRNEITKVEIFLRGLTWWDDDKNVAQTILDTLRWVAGDTVESIFWEEEFWIVRQEKRGTEGEQ